MNAQLHIVNIEDLFETSLSADFKTDVACVTLGKEVALRTFKQAAYYNAETAFLVLSGTAAVSINFYHIQLRAGDLVLLSPAHLFRLTAADNDFTCGCLLVGRTFMQRTDATDMIYKRIKYGARMFRQPCLHLSDTEVTLVGRRMADVAEAVTDTAHIFRTEKILNTIMSFYLDLSNIIEHDTDTRSEANISRYESLAADFVNLLAESYRTHHNADFYAEQLHVSAHYLSLLLKRVTGQSASGFIFEMLFSDARTQLRHSRLTVQQIAAALGFADQSSFGKFFKRKAGISPAEYRRQRI